MTTTFKDIVEAFDFVNFAPLYEHQAFLNKETGQVFWHTELGDDPEELPDDIDDAKYISIPHKNELELGKNLAVMFDYQHLPRQADEVEAIFRRKGAYSRFKDLLASKGALDQWYEYEAQAQDKALRQWCEENQIKVPD